MSHLAHSQLCRRYLESLSDHVSKLEEEYGMAGSDGKPIPVDSAYPAVRGLCEDLEKILMHNVARAWFGEETCWGLLRQLTRKEAVATINQLPDVRSDLDRVKVWTRMALNEACMGAYLEAMTQDPRLLNKNYVPGAFMRNSDLVSDLKNLVMPLSNYAFALPLSPALLITAKTTARPRAPSLAVPTSPRTDIRSVSYMPMGDGSVSSPPDDALSITSEMSRRRHRHRKKKNRLSDGTDYRSTDRSTMTADLTSFAERQASVITPGSSFNNTQMAFFTAPPALPEVPPRFVPQTAAAGNGIGLLAKPESSPAQLSTQSQNSITMSNTLSSTPAGQSNPPLTPSTSSVANGVSPKPVAKPIRLAEDESLSRKASLAETDLVMENIVPDNSVLRPSGTRNREQARLPATMEDDEGDSAGFTLSKSRSQQTVKSEPGPTAKAIRRLSSPIDKSNTKDTKQQAGWSYPPESEKERSSRAPTAQDTAPSLVTPPLPQTQTPEPVIDEPDFSSLLTKASNTWVSPMRKQLSQGSVSSETTPLGVKRESATSKRDSGGSNYSTPAAYSFAPISTPTGTTFSTAPTPSSTPMPHNAATLVTPRPPTSAGVSVGASTDDQTPYATPLATPVRPIFSTTYGTPTGVELVYQRLQMIYRGYQSCIRDAPLIAAISSVLAEEPPHLPIRLEDPPTPSPSTSLSTSNFSNLSSPLPPLPSLPSIPKLPFSSPVLRPFTDEQLLDALQPLFFICPEQGLIAQEFKCMGCGKDIGLLSGAPRLCGYNGRYYCVSCHGTTSHAIPARLLSNWDPSPRQVCNASATLLAHLEPLPVFDLAALNSPLEKYLPELRRIQAIRMQLNLAKDFLLSCRLETRMQLLRKVGDTWHYLDSVPTLYSIKDLMEVSNGMLEARLRVLTDDCIEHVKSCPLCTMKGSYCEICGSEEIIYPFNMTETVTCPTCKALAHRLCYKEGACPKCERMNKRKSGRINTSSK